MLTISIPVWRSFFIAFLTYNFYPLTTKGVGGLTPPCPCMESSVSSVNSFSLSRSSILLVRRVGSRDRVRHDPLPSGLRPALYDLSPCKVSFENSIFTWNRSLVSYSENSNGHIQSIFINDLPFIPCVKGFRMMYSLSRITGHDRGRDWTTRLWSGLKFFNIEHPK